jgi:hypothetical protein
MLRDCEEAGIVGHSAQGSILGHGPFDELNIVTVATIHVNYLAAGHPVRRISVNGEKRFIRPGLSCLFGEGPTGPDGDVIGCYVAQSWLWPIRHTQGSFAGGISGLYISDLKND